MLALVLVARPAHATPQDDILQARALAGQCRYAEALEASRKAVGALMQSGDPKLLLVARQDVATHANAVLDYRLAEQESRAALDLLAAGGEKSGQRWALVAQNLAISLAGQGRFAEAGPLFLAVTQALAGAQDRRLSLNAELAHAGFAANIGDLPGALQHADSAAAILRAGAIAPEVAGRSWLAIADIHRRSLRLEDAERDLAAAASAGVAVPRLDLVRAGILLERGRLREALETTELLASRKRPDDPCDRTLGIDIAQRLGSIRMLRREVPEAGTAFAAGLGEMLRLGIRDRVREGELVYGLAIVARMSRDFGRSEAMFDRAAALARERAGGRATEAEVQVETERALMLGEAGRPSEALAAGRRALELLRTAGGAAPLTGAYAHAALGLSAKQAGDYSLASAELDQALTAFKRARGASFDLGPGLTAQGEIALAEGRLGPARRLLRESLSVQKGSGADSTLALGTSYWQLSRVEKADNNRRLALSYSEQAVSVLRRRLAIGEAQPWNDAEIERATGRAIIAHDLALTTSSIAAGVLQTRREVVDRVLDDAQLTIAAATGAAIAQMTARLGEGNPALEGALRRRSDLAAEWRATQGDLLRQLSEPLSDEVGTRRIVDRQRQIAADLAAIDAALIRQDPKLGLLLKSRNVEAGDVQRLLSPREAVLVLAVADRESYAVVIRADKIAAYRISLSRNLLDTWVATLRTAFDPNRWKIETPAFDTNLAYRLYLALLSPAEPMLQGVDTLLFVPDGAMGSLPLGVLLTKPAPPVASYAGYSTLPWLIRRFAVANYPSLASVVALRTAPAEVSGGGRMLGVGDPLLRQGSDGPPDPATASRLPGDGGAADSAIIARLGPLPATREELGKIAKSIDPSQALLLLDKDATERKLRTMPLEPFAVIAFATHGLVAGDLVGYAEPALVLTQPAAPSPLDDGLLAASEIATLRLRADWVILSACNTAASDGSPDAAPLSGLAKSFFYAGARALLVTNWAVDSPSAVYLTTHTVENTARSGRAAALRTAMLDLIADRDGTHRMHPYFWAPFSLVGE